MVGVALTGFRAREITHYSVSGNTTTENGYNREWDPNHRRGIFEADEIVICPTWIECVRDETTSLFSVRTKSRFVGVLLSNKVIPAVFGLGAQSRGILGMPRGSPGSRLWVNLQSYHDDIHFVQL